MKYELAILGAGPAGLSCALEAAKQGVNVTLFEKGIPGEQINCGEGYFDLFHLTDKPVDGILYRVQTLSISALRDHILDCSSLKLWMLDRRRWQQRLLELALQNKVDLMEKTPIHLHDLDRLSRCYKWVADATGFPGITMQVPVLRRDYQQNHWAVTLQYLAEGNFNRHLSQFRVSLHKKRVGYYWIFPKTGNLARLGVGLFEPRNYRGNLKKDFQEFLELENQPCRILEAKGGRIPVFPMWKHLQRGNIFLIGDAAGLASPLHGGGLDTSVASGHLLGKLLAQGNPQAYPQALQELLHKKTFLEGRLAFLWKRLGITFMERMLLFLGSTGLAAIQNRLNDTLVPWAEQ